MTSASTFRFVRHLVPLKAAVAAMVSAAAISGCATPESLPATPASYRSDGLVDKVDTLDAAAPIAAPEAPVSAVLSADSPEALARLLDEGEAAYRARRHDEALAAFQQVVTIDPAQTQAWLRMGNLHHRRGKWFEALSAYRRAAARGSGDGADVSLRAKALYNLTLINLELAKQALRTLERIGLAAAAAGEREPLSDAVESVRRRLDAFGEAALAQPPATRSAARSAARPDPPARSAPRQDSGTRDALPRVDYFRGAPKP